MDDSFHVKQADSSVSQAGEPNRTGGMSVIGTSIRHDEAFERNRTILQSQLSSISSRAAKIEAGGGAEALARHRQRGKLTARQRISNLIDPGSQFLELGLFSAHGMYEEFGGAPAAGTILGIGKIHGRDVVVVANDATVKAGAWFPMT